MIVDDIKTDFIACLVVRSLKKITKQPYRWIDKCCF